LFSYYGEIWLESQEGIGSAFIFVAAVKNKGKKSQTNRIQKHEKEIVPKIKKKLKMLIADDDIISRKLLKSVHEFAKESKQKTGREAIEKFKENTNVDLILIDVQMPDINGYEATKEIRELNSDVIIITQSAVFMETGKSVIGRI
jgi:PleD family two-component response regulator